MARSLNKLFVFLLCIPALSFSQTVDKIYAPPDYKTAGDFKHYKKYREEICKWQINQLKSGALLVRLRNNKSLADQLRNKNQADLATAKEHEAFAINKNIVRAFLKNYNFSKVYFFYSENSDTLLNGARSGFFLDSNLTVDPSIKMTEQFYLIAERDVVYNSSIGFVKEDTARFITEAGNETRDVPIILKNKYGHQLKEPFPYFATYNTKGLRAGNVTEYISYNGGTVGVSLDKRYTKDKWQSYILELNVKLNKFYLQNKDYQTTIEEVKPFLY